MIVRTEYFVRLLAVAFTLSLFAAYSDSAERPNIVIVYSDDQRADTIAAWGNESIQTPNLDRLARTGFSFRANYCFGGNSGAVCVPSRAMLNTGRNWFHVKHDMSDARQLSEVLRDQGYATFGIGKWHNGAASFSRGYRHGEAVFLGGMSDHTQVPLVDFVEGELTNQRIGERFSSELFADAAVKFLKNYDADRPFLLYVAFTAPHDPRQPPARYREYYYERRPPLPNNFLPQHPFDNGHMKNLRDENLAGWPRTEAVISDQLAEYYGMITHFDEQLGRVLDTLQSSRHADSTYVIFASDHGLAMGSHGLLGKQNVYEHSMRSPMIMVGPGIPAGGKTDAFTYLYDVFPTVCSLTGTPLPAGLDGVDLSPLWKHDTVPSDWRTTVFLPYLDLMRSVRDRRWKLIRYPPINHTQLFDLQADPDELHNLADDHPQEVERMMAMLSAAQRQAGDSLPLTTKNPKSKEIDLTRQPREPDQWQPTWIVEKYFQD